MNQSFQEYRDLPPLFFVSDNADSALIEVHWPHKLPAVKISLEGCYINWLRFFAYVFFYPAPWIRAATESEAL